MFPSNHLMNSSRSAVDVAANGMTHAAMTCVTTAPIAPSAIVMAPAAADAATEGTAPGAVSTDGTMTGGVVESERRPRSGKERGTRGGGTVEDRDALRSGRPVFVEAVEPRVAAREPRRQRSWQRGRVNGGLWG